MGNTKRKAVEKHLVLLMCLILAVGLMPSTAFADESYPDVTTPVYAGTEPGQTPVVDVGNVTVNTSDPSNTFAVYSHARNDADATANVHGSTTFEGTTTRGDTSALARSTGGTATLEVVKDVTADITFEGSDQPEITGLGARSDGDGAKTIANIGGDVTVNATKNDDSRASIGAIGILQTAIPNTPNPQTSSQVVVNGDVAVAATTDSGITTGDAQGIIARADKSASASTIVMGDVMVKAAAASGMQVSGYMPTEGSDSSIAAKTTIMVGRNLIVESNSSKGQSWGIESVSQGGLITVYIGGDVTSTSSNGQAMGISASANEGSTDILIENTLTARTAGVVGSSKGGQLDITVWKIDSDLVAGKSTGPFKFEEDTAMEKAINYIIKVEQPQEGNILSLLGTTIKEFPTLDGKRSFDVANMGQKVYLNVEEGWIITAAFNGKGDKIALEKDDQGWFVIVPNGGGVYLSAQVAKAGPAPTPTPIPSPTPAYEPGSNDGAGYLPATGDSPIAAIVLALTAVASLALALFAASRMNGRRSCS